MTWSIAAPECLTDGERSLPLAQLQFITVAPAALIRHSISGKADSDVLGPEFRPCCDKIGFLAIRLSRQGQEEPNLTGTSVAGSAHAALGHPLLPVDERFGGDRVTRPVSILGTNCAPTARVHFDGEDVHCGFVDASCEPAVALRDVWTSRG